MATGTYGTTAPPEKLAGFLVQAQARFRLGLQSTFGALETSSGVYTAYSASIGILDAQALDVGMVGSLGVNINATVEAFDAANERLPSIYYVSGETAEITAAVTQFTPQLMELLMHQSVLYDLGDEVLLTFGTICNVRSQPLQLDVTNLSCFLPDSQSIDLGLTAFILTFYDVMSSGGLNIGALVAKNLNTVDTTWQARPVDSLANGNQVGNLYAF